MADDSDGTNTLSRLTRRTASLEGHGLQSDQAAYHFKWGTNRRIGCCPSASAPLGPPSMFSEYSDPFNVLRAPGHEHITDESLLAFSTPALNGFACPSGWASNNLDNLDLEEPETYSSNHATSVTSSSFPVWNDSQNAHLPPYHQYQQTTSFGHSPSSPQQELAPCIARSFSDTGVQHLQRQQNLIPLQRIDPYLRATPLPIMNKRTRRELIVLGASTEDKLSERPTKIARSSGDRTVQPELDHTHEHDVSKDDRFMHHNEMVPSHMGVSELNTKQKDFIRKWFEDFAAGQAPPILGTEEYHALATLIKTPSQLVWEYINRKYPNPASLLPTHNLRVPKDNSFDVNIEDIASSTTYSVLDANKHLPPTTLRLVEKYIQGSQRRRAHTDGRRKVNNGPFRCTYGCGYRTKRVFDWRRHEETHSPQELWLCHYCVQNGDQTPFLVNRRDKFLRHAKEIHKEREAEDVLDISRVDFRAEFDPQCPRCPDTTSSWEDRCKHIIAHFEDEEHGGSKGMSERSRSRYTSEVMSNEEGSGLNEDKDSNDSWADDDVEEG